MEMDLELGLFVLGVALVTGIAVYFVSVMGIREKSFEEAIAEQKKRSEDLLGKREKKKVNVKDKTKKQNKKKEKEKLNAGEVSDDAAEAVHQSEHHNEHGRHHVEIMDEPEIFDEPLPSESRRASVVRREAIRSILTNKEDRSPVGIDREESEPANHFEMIHPKDDAELIHLRTSRNYITSAGTSDETPPPSPIVPPLPPRKSRGKRDDVAAQKGSGDSGNLSGVYENVPVEEQLIDQAQVEQVKSGRPVSPESTPELTGNRASAISSKGKKSKGRSGSSDQDEMNAGKLESAIERVPLSSSEIQNLIDILLNKQHAGDSEWINKGKNDSVGNLKKQLADRENQLSEEQSAVQSLQGKLKELRTEYSNEKNKFASVRRQLEETAAQKMSECQNIHLRLKQMSDVGIGEKQELQKQIRQLQQRCKDIQDENEVIKVDYRNYRDSDQGMRAKAESLEREIGALKTQYERQGSQLQAAFQSNGELTNSLRSLQEHLNAVEERKKQDESIIHGHYVEKETHFMTEIKKMQDLLTDTEKERSTLRQQVVNLQNSNLRNSSETNKTLDDVTKKLEDSQKAEKNTKNLLEDAKAQLGSLQKNLSDKEIHIKKLEDERGALAAQVGTLTERLSAAAQAQESEKINGSVKGKDNSKDEAQLGLLQGRLDEKQNLISQLETETKSLKNEVEKTVQDVKAQKDKNDELRLKNSKLLESLNLTEKNLESRLVECEKLVHVETRIKDTFHKYFPKVAVEKTKATWAEDFATSIQEELKKVETASNSNGPASVDSKSSEELSQLVDVNTKLKDEVTHYQEVLARTESLLESLQGSIETEEQGWLERLGQKEAEVVALKTSISSEAANPDLSKLSSELASEREAKSVISQRCSELENNIQNLKTQADQFELVRKRVADLQEELETERRKHQDLLTENTKLQTLVSTGNESLDRVKQLESEIAQLKSQTPVAPTSPGPTNGVSNGSPASEKSAGVKEIAGAVPPYPVSPVSSPTSPTSTTTTTAAPPNPETTPTVEKKKKKNKGASAKK